VVAFVVVVTVPTLHRRRLATPGPEHELLTAALSTYVSRVTGGPIYFHEPELPTGFPDVVAVFHSRRPVTVSPYRRTLAKEHLKLLQHLTMVEHSCLHHLSRSLGWSRRTLDRLVDDLLSARLLRATEDGLSSVPLPETFVARRIVAIEAKIDKWSLAIRQAVANTWFASHSYILLPDDRWGDGPREEAGRYGIGVLTYNGIQMQLRLRAAQQRVPVSYGSWLINEWTVRHLEASIRA
jgi:hypothetical protein